MKHVGNVEGPNWVPVVEPKMVVTFPLCMTMQINWTR